MEKRVRDLTDEDFDRMCKKYNTGEAFCCSQCPLARYCPCAWDDELDDIVVLDDPEEE